MGRSCPLLERDKPKPKANIWKQKGGGPPFRDELVALSYAIMRYSSIEEQKKAKAALRNRPHRTGLPTGDLTLRMRNPMEAKAR